MSSDPGAIPLVRPPTLRHDKTRGATRLELFFDLAYVLAVAALATNLVVDVDWGAVGEFAFLLVLIWLSWVQFTLYNNRFDTDDIVLRLAKFGAMAAVLGCAASVYEATASLSAVFATSYLVGRLVLLLLYARAWRHVEEARSTIGVYLVGSSAVIALWALSLVTPPPVRLVLWGVGAVVDIVTPIVATHRSAAAPLHLEHLPERFGLLVILVLGEVAAAVVAGLHDTNWDVTSSLVAGTAFLVAVAAWWAYFDVSEEVSANALRDAQEDAEQEEADSGADDDEVAKVDQRHDLFVYGHLPVTAGLLAAGVGLEELIIHPHDVLPSAGSWLVVGGLATFLAGTALVLGGTEPRVGRALRWPGVAVPVMLGLGFVGPRDPLLFGLATAVLLAIVVAVGTVLSRRQEV